MKKFTIAIFTFLFWLTASAQWEWQNPLPHGNSMDDVTFINENVGWAAGGNIVMKTIDSGNSWETQYHMDNGFMPSNIVSICFTDSEQGWAVGYPWTNTGIVHGKVWYTSDGGDNWEEQFALGGISSSIFKSVFFTDQDNGWVAGSFSDNFYGPHNSIILHTSDAGITWQIQLDDEYDGFTDVYFTDADNGWAVGNSGTIVHTSNAGETWEEQNSNVDVELSGVYFTDLTNGWTIGEAGTILHTTNGGITWNQQSLDPDLWLTDVSFASSDKGWVTGTKASASEGLVLNTIDGGINWTIQAVDPNRGLFGICFIDPDKGWAVGTYGSTLTTTNGGNTWVSEGGYVTLGGLFDIDFVDENFGWAVGRSGTIVHTSNAGETWEVMTSGTDEDLKSVCFVDQFEGWIAGGGYYWSGILLHTTDGGNTWTTVLSDSSYALRSIIFTDNDNGWVVGRNGTLLHTDNGGNNWIQQYDSTYGFNDVFFIDNESGWVVGDGIIISTTDGGDNWDFQYYDPSSDDVFRKVFFSDQEHGWALGNEYPSNGPAQFTLRTTDGGNTWEYIDVPWVGYLYDILFINNDTGWVVGSGGRILLTTDAGDSWTEQSSPTGNSLNSVCFTDDETGWVVGSNGTILHTINGGASGQIIHVPGDQPSIQAGINAALDGDTVLVSEGTWYENIRFMGKEITVASEFIMDGDTSHISNTIIDGSQAADPDSAAAVMFVNNEDTTSIINGFTITGGSGVLFTTSAARIGGGVFCGDAGAKILNNKIVENHISHENKAGGAGIGCQKVSGNYWIIIKNNFISYNSSTTTGLSAYGGGIYSVVNTIIEDNTIVHNQCNNSAGMADGGGIEIEQLSGDIIITEIIGNIIRHNVIEGINGNGGGVVVIRSKAKILDNSITFNSVIAENNGNGGGIWVDTPSDEIGMFSNDISYNTITAGHYGRGGGIVFWNPKAELTLIGNKINNNNVSEAVECRGAGVLFRCNLFPTGKIRVIHNEFIGNIGNPDADHFNGGGVCINDAWDTLVIFDGNRFEGNTAIIGGGLFSRRSYNLQLTNNLFINNSSINGGGLGLYHFASDEKMTFHPEIVNNTLYNNYSDYGGGMFLNCETNVPVILNNIFWENDALSGGEIYYYNGIDTLYVAYCDIDQNSINGTPWKGIGNINADPKFIDPGSGNYCIDSCYSPCAGSGIDTLYIDENVWYLAPDHDILGRNRPIPSFTQPDIGAYEVDMCVGIEESKFLISNFNFQIYPNPSFGISDIRYQIKPAPTKEGDIRFVVLEVFDINGQEIRTLVSRQQKPGEYFVQFDGSGLPAGIYLVKLQAGDVVETAKILLIK